MLRLLRTILIWLAIGVTAGIGASASLLFALVTWSDYRDFTFDPDCQIEMDEELRKRTPGAFDFSEFTPFEWDEIRTYGEYSSADLLRADGIDYEPTHDHVPENHYFLAFFEEGEWSARRS